MEKLKKSFLFRLCFSLFLMFLLTVSLDARGREERDYREAMSASFEQIIGQMESGRLTVEEGKAQLAEVRARLRPGYTDFDGMMDALIDRLAEGKISYGEALALFRRRVSPEIDPGSNSGTGAAEGQKEANKPEEGKRGSSGGTSESGSDNSGRGKNGQ